MGCTFLWKKGFQNRSGEGKDEKNNDQYPRYKQEQFTQPEKAGFFLLYFFEKTQRAEIYNFGFVFNKKMYENRDYCSDKSNEKKGV